MGKPRNASGTERPRSLRCASVTIITRDSGLADALSTALFCMSYEDGLALAKSLGGVEVLWINHDGTLLYTDGLKDKFIN